MSAQQANSPRHTHIHFGPGKLGIGLVLALLNYRLPLRLVIFGRRSKDWKVHAHEKSIVLRSKSGDDQIRWQHRVKLLHDEGNARLEDLRIAAEKDDVLICSDIDHWDAFRGFIEQANTITTSLEGGQQELIGLLTKCHFRARPVPLYPFENVSEFDESTETLEKCGMKVCRVIADRICSDREFPENSVEVKCEDYAEVIIFEKDRKEKSSPFDPDFRVAHPDPAFKAIKFVSEERLFDYYYKRKRYLVNAVQHVLAIYSYSKLLSHDIPTREWARQHLDLLQEAINNAESASTPHIKTFIAGQIARLMIEQRQECYEELDTAEDDERTFYKLRAFCDRVLLRTKGHADYLGRILDFKRTDKTERRFVEHFLHFSDFNEEHSHEIDSLPIREKVQSEDVRATLNDATRTLMVLLLRYLKWTLSPEYHGDTEEKLIKR